MSINNLYQTNTDNLFCNTLTCNDLNNGQGPILSFATNGNTINASGIPSFPYNMYCLVIGKFMICTFNSPNITPLASSFVFDVPYPAGFSPINVNNTTSFGHGTYAGNTPNTQGTLVLDSEDIGQQYIHCSGKLSSTGSNGVIRATFVVNLN